MIRRATSSSFVPEILDVDSEEEVDAFAATLLASSSNTVTTLVVPLVEYDDDKKGGGEAAKKADPKAATAICAKDDKANKESDACKACCSKNGSDSHMWMLGKGCKCHVEF